MILEEKVENKNQVHEICMMKLTKCQLTPKYHGLLSSVDITVSLKIPFFVLTFHIVQHLAHSTEEQPPFASS